MTDIVERLKALVILDEVNSNNQLGKEAAAEITRLRALVEEMVANSQAALECVQASAVRMSSSPNRGNRKGSAHYQAVVNRLAATLAKAKEQP